MIRSIAAGLACLSLCALATLALSAPAVQPELLDLWRTIFARPDTTPEAIPASPGNPITQAKVDLGRRLFHDNRLSGNKDRSCATCHRPELAYSDGLQLGPGRDGRRLSRNVPGLSNLAWAKRLFWDGRATSLEEQAAGPILHPDEMGGSWGQIAERLGADADMTALFQKAFPAAASEASITPQSIAQALSAYERTLVSPVTRFDRYIAGEPGALSETEERGFSLFVGRAGCVSCHGGWRFTDDRLHDIGLSRTAEDEGAPRLFKTPSLRELTHTAPYMHDGSKATLEDVIAHYNDGFEARPELSPNIVRGMDLSSAEREALIAFLKSLSSD